MYLLKIKCWREEVSQEMLPGPASSSSEGLSCAVDVSVSVEQIECSELNL